MIIGDDKWLKEYIVDSQLEISEFIRLSVLVTEMVYREHRQTSVIGCLSPSTISLQRDGKSARLSESSQWQGAYQSPEQSGRLNRVPDERSDLYVLGVILYELLTGRLPFRPDHEEEWDTAHIHMIPRPPAEIRPESDGPLQSVILKLLVKSPEDRYQSAYGLLDDLKQCRRMLEGDGKLAPFDIGRLDHIRTFRVSESLYGRDSAMEQLEAGLEQAVHGLKAFRWVIGEEGIGKTALVHRLRSKVVRRGGRFVEGGGQPSLQLKLYEPLIQALRQWIQQLWSEPADVIAGVKIRFRTEYWLHSRLIISLLPEAEPLFESRSAETAALGAEDWNRFGELLPGLVRCFASCTPPLVLFIDDLERADTGTLAVIRVLTMEESVPGLLLIGACREQANEHAWLAERWRTNPAEQVALLSFGYEHVRRYVADALHEDSARIRLLARSLYNQTAGNPRSLRLLMESWLKEKKLGFDEERRQWTWDPEVVRQMGDSEANYRLMEAGFVKLPDETKRLLAMAAAIGPTFRLSVLSEACGYAPETAFLLINGAETEGIVWREDETAPEDGQDRIYMFVHDDMHRMAYAFDTERNAQRHLKIGQLLQRRQSGSNEDTMLAAIDHLNLGVTVMPDRETRQLAEHNLQAGLKVLEDGHYAKGKRYAEAGLRLAAEEQEIESGSLILQLRVALAWSEYMCGNTEQARKLLLELKDCDGKLSRAERSQIWKPLIQFHGFVENEIAVQYGIEALTAYGWKPREKSTKFAIIKEVMHTRFLLNRNRDRLHHFAPDHDEDYAALCGHMEQLFFPLLEHDAGALVELYARFIRYGIKKGMNESLALMIGAYELLLQRVIPYYAEVVPFGDLESIHSTIISDSRFKHRFALIWGMSKQLEKPAEASAYMVKAMRRGLELADKEFANAALITCLVTYNGDLYALSDLLNFFEIHMRQNANDKILEMVSVASNYVATLQDETLQDDFVAIPAPSKGDSEQQDEDNYSCGCRLEAAYLTGKYREALYWAKWGRENELAADWARVRKQRFYETLTLAALYPEVNSEERRRIRKAMRKQLRNMKKWQGFLGLNSSGHLLMRAEWERIAGNQLGALREYTAAVKQARVEKYGLMEGIACERLADCYRNDLISRSGAMIAMMDACTAYSVWGVTSKVTQIKNKHADLLNYASRSYEGQVLEGKTDYERPIATLPQRDVPGEQGASKSEDDLLREIVSWSGKLNKINWMESFLEAALRQAGADRGFVLICRENGYSIGAGLDIQPDDEAAGLYAEGVLRHTLATNEPFVLHDASQSYFMKDPYIEARRPRSILCMPIVVPGERSTLLLYLENRHVAGVFIDRDVKVLELILTRMIYYKMLDDETAAAAEAPFAASSVQLGMIEPLTGREIEIIAAIAEGLSNRDIAERFGIAETTVKTHTSRIFGKLGVKRRGQAVVRAKELQLID
ncbi:AAA family ATPase [Cohnella terricola]|uniref:AAA family ATPase n=1 Tax=Cohnella terricola TaxID=1289167 RepID=A0A559JGN2_9BACL|nr:AAA family ATPase [Cohnella terricola]TVX99033.1 AAA family ATPase [Cohnella terricola]